MALQFVITINFLFLLTSGLAEVAPIAQPGCNTACGNVTSIPYPFGIGSADCYMDDWFEIVCNETGAFLKKIDMEVLEIFINPIGGRENNTVVVKSSAISSNPTLCSGISSDDGVVNIKGSPFVLSDYSNIFISAGCNNTATMLETDPMVAGCKSHCNESLLINEDGGLCSGYTCCRTVLPRSGLQLFNVDFIDATDKFTDDVSTDIKIFQEGCRYALLADNTWMTTSSFSVEKITDVVPVVLAWRIYNWTNNSTEMVDSFNNNRSDFQCRIYPTEKYRLPYMVPASYDKKPFIPSGFLSFSCVCQGGYQGNPYLSAGCRDINECENSTLYSCPSTTICQNTIGGYYCNKKETKKDILRSIIIGILTSIGGLSLFIFTWCSYEAIKKMNEINLKKKFFKKNGGLLLQQQLHSGENSVQNIKLFTTEDLKMSTDQFNKSKILGKGGQGTVYKGMLIDGRIVAIKKCNKDTVDQRKLELFINEIIILSQINHRNVVKLLGCCLETEVPLLVYEFISNGTLFQYLHEECEDFPLTWDQRLRIASEVAGALFYLHSAASLPIIHRDIKSENILLDDKYRAKIADFGISKSMAIEKTHLTTKIYGTFGYLDPEYFQRGRLTEKSDVYSFGVILAELLTGEKPIFLMGTEEAEALAKYFTRSIEENFLFDILDDQVKKDGDEKKIKVVANLAKRCLRFNGRRRPTMAEVTKEIEDVRKVSSGQENYEELDSGRMEEIEPWDDISTSTPSTSEMVPLHHSTLSVSHSLSPPSSNTHLFSLSSSSTFVSSQQPQIGKSSTATY